MNGAESFTNVATRLYRDKLSPHLGGALIFVLASAVLLFAWHQSNRRASTSDYEGVIVDRWGNYVESGYGAKPVFRLLVESSEGRRFPVEVDSNIYESAKIGMRIKSQSGQLTLLGSEPPDSRNK